MFISRWAWHFACPIFFAAVSFFPFEVLAELQGLARPPSRAGGETFSRSRSISDSTLNVRKACVGSAAQRICFASPSSDCFRKLPWVSFVTVAFVVSGASPIATAGVDHSVSSSESFGVSCFASSSCKSLCSMVLNRHWFCLSTRVREVVWWFICARSEFTESTLHHSELLMSTNRPAFSGRRTRPSLRPLSRCSGMVWRVQTRQTGLRP